MTTMRCRHSLACLVAALALAAPARADTPNRCDSPAILTEIARQQDMRIMDGGQALRITGFTAIESRGTAPRATPPGARRFCAAQARLGDGSTRPIWYVLDEDAADGGARARVDFCLSGLDPQGRHGVDCEAVK